MPSSERDIPFYRQNNIYIYIYILFWVNIKLFYYFFKENKVVSFSKL